MDNSKDIDRKKVRESIIVSDYNQFKDLYEQMEPALRRIYREEEVPFPDDLYQLLDEVIKRQFEEGKHGIIAAELRNKDFERSSKLIEKAVRENLNTHQEYELPEYVLQQIDTFAGHKHETKLCSKVLKALEIRKMDDAIVMKSNGRINKAATRRKVCGDLTIGDDKKHSVKNWMHGYIDKFW